MAGEYIEFDNNNQPAVNDTNLNRLQQLIKQDIQGAVSGDTLPIGTIVPFGSNTVPENWLLCDGSAVSRTTYQDLFNTIGITYGQGDGFETFNLPDLRDRVPVGKDSNDTDFNLLGNTGGEKEHTLTIDEMPAHNHTYRLNINGDAGTVRSIPRAYDNNSYNRTNTTENAGANQPHNILQPYIVTNYIIKAFQSAGTVATVIDNLNSTSTTDALSANQGKVLNELLKGTVLYSDNTGSSTSITLSESVANFDYIEIYFAGEQGGTYNHNFLKVDSPNNKQIVLSAPISGANNLYFIVARGLISGTNISLENNRRVYFSNNGPATFDNAGTLYITKIIGYNY